MYCSHKLLLDRLNSRVGVPVPQGDGGHTTGVGWSERRFIRSHHAATVQS